MRKSTLLLSILILSGSGCVSIGTQFPGDRVTDIHIGATTQQEIQQTYGSPTRTGYSSGQVTWTYLDYYVNALGTARLRDLTVTFDEKGKVVSYSYNTNESGKKP